MEAAMNGAAPVFNRYVFPTIASVAASGLALACVSFGIAAFRWSIGI